MSTPAKRKPRPPGRPSLFTPERVDKIVLAVRGGAPRHSAAAYAGVSKGTLHAWLAKGHAGEPGFSEFLDRVEEAEGARIVKSAATISSQADWRAHAWLLERWTPEYRRPPEQVEMSNPDGSMRPTGPIILASVEAQRLIRELSSIDEPPAGVRGVGRGDT